MFTFMFVFVIYVSSFILRVVQLSLSSTNGCGYLRSSDITQFILQTHNGHGGSQSNSIEFDSLDLETKTKHKNRVTEETRASGRILLNPKRKKMVSLGIEPRTFPEHLL
jgi:hypothetical protein